MKIRSDKRFTAKNQLEVFNRTTNQAIGNLANLSTKGLMLLTKDAIKVSSEFKCKIELNKTMLDHNEILLEATCCWCRKNIKSGLWESGYQIEASGIDSEMLSYLSLSFVLDHLVEPNNYEYKIIELENRRCSTRYEPKKHFPVYEKNSPMQVGEVVDISQGGVKMTTELMLKEGSVVAYRAKLPKRIFQRDYLFFDAICQWQKINEATGQYEIGLKFNTLSQQDSVIILHLMIHNLEELPSEDRVKVV